MSRDAVGATAAAHRVNALAGTRGVHRAFHWLHLNELQLRRWQMEFLAIPAPPFGETERARWFLEKFRALGLENVRLDAEGNALGEFTAAKPASDGRAVMLSAHLDTVFPAGTDCVPRESSENPVIHGPGACDNGAGLAALLGIAAAMEFAKLRPACTILFAANVGEEGEGNLRGMRHLFSAESAYFRRIRAAVALEGAGTGTVIDRALGSRRLRVTVTGPGGHSWADAGRPNAILALSAGLLAVARIPLPARPRTTLNCGTIAGGTSVNSIPGSATADLDLRSVSALELDRTELAVLRTLAATIDAENARVSGEAELRLHVERIGDRAAGALAASSALMLGLRAVDRHLGVATESRIGSTDANLPLSLGVPALAVGAGGVGVGIHTLAESYDPTGRELALRRVLLLVLDACTLAAGDGL